MFIKGMLGLGDGIYARAFVKNYPGHYLETPWPELYGDIDVKCVRPTTMLRTQAKNIARHTEWHPPIHGPQLQISYGRDPIINGLRKSFRCEPKEFDLPDFGASPVTGKYVLVRPATVRTEWRADTRNPEPRYIAEAAAEMRKRGYKVVSVADLQHSVEWALDPLPVADATYHQGELPVEQLLSLLQHAAAVIGGIGWLVPAAIAAKVPAWIICGGQGGFNSPKMITDACMDLSSLQFAVPDKMCMCTMKQHDCDKRISNHGEKFAAWADGLTGAK